MSVLTHEQLKAIKNIEKLFGSRESSDLRTSVCIEKIKKDMEKDLQPDWYCLDRNSGDYVKLNKDGSADNPNQCIDYYFVAPHNCTKEEAELLASELNEVVIGMGNAEYAFNKEDNTFSITSKHYRYEELSK